MNKANVLQIIALILLVLGGYILYERLTAEEVNASFLSGIAPIIMAIALFIISKSKSFKGEQDS
ncbi:MAG: hypothetical protein R8P61_36560 [Bacteroidia bacterium]|nr:hypothetical protein [Bacteroidia bacterium]